MCRVPKGGDTPTPQNHNDGFCQWWTWRVVSWEDAAGHARRDEEMFRRRGEDGGKAQSEYGLIPPSVCTCHHETERGVKGVFLGPRRTRYLAALVCRYSADKPNDLTTRQRRTR